MRIVSLEPSVTALLISLGLGEQLSGVTADCILPPELSGLPKVTLPDTSKSSDAYIYPELSRRVMDLAAIRDIRPDLIIGSLYKPKLAALPVREEIIHVQAQLSVQLRLEVKFASFAPRTLEEVYSELKALTALLKIPARGVELSGKIKAQIMNWADNFYERIKNKKVSFLSSIQPLRLAGYWMPDMIQLLSAQSQNHLAGTEDKDIRWEELLGYRPDVIVVAPRGFDLKQSMAAFKEIEKFSDWESIPAVKRGEVIFCEGREHFYQPAVNMIDSMAILVSALAGFESGYITPRDTFYRLRWLEMQRHKF